MYTSTLLKWHFARVDALHDAGAYATTADYREARKYVRQTVEAFEAAIELLGDHVDEYYSLKPEYVLCRYANLHRFPTPLELVGFNVEGGYGLTFFGICERCKTKRWTYKVKRADGRLRANGSPNYDYPPDYGIGVALPSAAVVALETLDQLDDLLAKMEKAHKLKRPPSKSRPKTA